MDGFTCEAGTQGSFATTVVVTEPAELKDCSSQ